MESSFIICLERDSDCEVGIGIVRRACFCLDKSLFSFLIEILHHAIFPLFKVAMYEGII